MSVPVALGQAADAQHGIDRALSAIEGELAVVFGRAERVTEACGVLERLAPHWTQPGARDTLDRMARLLRARAVTLLRPLADLLRRAAASAHDPWLLLEILLSANDDAIALDALDALVAQAEGKEGRVGLSRAVTLAEIVERSEGVLSRDEVIARLGRILRRLDWAGAPPGDPVLAAYLAAPSEPLRRLAGRVLDLSGAPPAAATTRAIVGPDAAQILEGYLAYTRARHLDLLDLVGAEGTPGPLAEDLGAAERLVDPALLRDVIAELGWRRVNLGLEVRPVAGISVDESLPFLLTPAEAGIVGRCPGAVRAFDAFLIVAHGGAPGEGGPPSPEPAPIDRFRTYNVAHAEVLAEMLDAGPLTPQRIHAILARMDRIVGDFSALFRQRTEEAAAAERAYQEIKARVLGELQGASGSASLSPALTRLVLMFEDPQSAGEVRTLHGLKRYLHQKGLALGFGLLESGRGTNRTVTLAVASPRRLLHVARHIDYVDFEREPRARGGAGGVPYAVSVVADAFAQQLLHGEDALPSVKVYCYGNEVHYFVTFRNHPAFVRIDFSPPLGGGMIDLQYYGVSKYDLDTHPRVSLDGIRALFERLDFDVDVENTRVHARYDKERALTLTDLCEHAEMLFRLAPYLMDVDWIIGQLELDDGARQRVGRGWAELFARWGVLPLRQLLTSDRVGIVAGHEPVAEGTAERRWSGFGSYADRFTGRPSRRFLTDLRAQLFESGLAEFVPTERAEEAAQMPLVQRVLRPLRRAVARGEVTERDDVLAPAPADCFERLHEAQVFAQILGGDDAGVARAARLAQLGAALERSVHFETTGAVNGYEVQRAWLELRDETVGLYVLRDRDGMARLAVYGPEGTLSRRRAGAGAPWRDTVSDDLGWLASHLRRNNFLPSWIDSPIQDAVDVAAVRRSFATPSPVASRRPLPGEHVLEGVKASPGRAVGPALLGLEARDPAHVDGGILVVPSLRPVDCPFLFRASGVVCTGGSILSHAGLMAVECGRPALIVRGRWERHADGRTRVHYVRTEYQEVGRRVGDIPIVERRNVREHDAILSDGDLIALDANEATVRVLGQEPTAIALHDGLAQLARSNARLSQVATDAEALVERGRRLRAMHQLERLFLRLDDPVLVHHAVRELLLGTGTSDTATGRRDKARLIELLLATSASAASAHDAVVQVSRGLAERLDAATADLERRVPVSSDPGEVLGLRLTVARLRALLAAVRGAAPSVASEVADEGRRTADDLDRMVEERLEAQRTELRSRVGTVLDPIRPLAGARHVLGVVARLDHLLGSTEEMAGWRASAERALAAADERTLDRVATQWTVSAENGGVELEPLVGWKTAFLAEIERLGHGALVPPWFVLTDRAFQATLDAPAPATGAVQRGPETLRESIRRVLANGEVSAAQKAEQVRRLWAAVALPADVAAAAAEAYRRLASAGPAVADVLPRGVSDDPAQPFVAVRSSAHIEDTDTAAHAGEFDTYLFVRGEHELIDHVKRAWSGLWTERAVHNRLALGLGDGMEGGGVLVQRMVWSRAAGVLQTTNVADGLPYELVINVGLGLGEGVVSGLVAADHVVVSKERPARSESLRFRYVTAEKRERTVFDVRSGRGTVRVATLSHQRLRPVLEYVELVELAEVATSLEAVLGQALDIEFAYEGPRLYILQVRRIPAWRALWEETARRYPLSGTRGP